MGTGAPGSELELATRHHAAGRLGEAEAVNLGNVLRTQGRPAEAADLYRAASVLRPDDPGPYRGLGAVCLEMGLLRQGLANFRRCSNPQPQSPSAHSDLLFWLLHDPDLSPGELFEEHLRRANRHEKPLQSGTPAAFDNDPAPSGERDGVAALSVRADPPGAQDNYTIKIRFEPNDYTGPAAAMVMEFTVRVR